MRSTLHEKTEFCKNVKFASAALAFLYGSYFNANLSRYALKIYFVFKKLILRKNIQISSNYPMHAVMPISKSRVQVERTGLRLKKYRLVHLKSYWEQCKICHSSRSITQNCLLLPTMLVNTFEDFKPPSILSCTPEFVSILMKKLLHKKQCYITCQKTFFACT